MIFFIEHKNDFKDNWNNKRLYTHLFSLSLSLFLSHEFIYKITKITFKRQIKLTVSLERALKNRTTIFKVQSPHLDVSKYRSRQYHYCRRWKSRFSGLWETTPRGLHLSWSSLKIRAGCVIEITRAFPVRKHAVEADCAPVTCPRSNGLPLSPYGHPSGFVCLPSLTAAAYNGWLSRFRTFTMSMCWFSLLFCSSLTLPNVSIRQGQTSRNARRPGTQKFPNVSPLSCTVNSRIHARGYYFP